MAKVAASPSTRANDVFSSVFASSSLSYRKADNKRVKLTSASTFSKQKLREGLKPLLGIGVDKYVYGLDGRTAEGEPFRLPVERCEDMKMVREVSRTDWLQWRNAVMKAGVWRWVRQWRDEIGADGLKKAIAEVLDVLLRQYVNTTYSECYRPDIVAHLEFWVQHIFAGLVKICLQIFESSNEAAGTEGSKIEQFDLKRYHDIALTTLGALRVDELYSIIVNYNDENPGINDLRRFTTSPATRSFLTTHFTDTLSTRLLHPGTSTIDILHIYISIIRAFRRLDSKGVLLDRVARRVRKYLRDRDDTIKVIVSGLLSDPFAANGQPIPYDAETLTELALELSRRDESTGEDDNELDWDNMNWVPDPIDAAPDYMKSKNTDVVGSLTSLFESKDIFVKELQNTLAERLLKNKATFDLEIGVVDHLKTRFGQGGMQGCEVMLRDVIESRKIDGDIRREQSQSEPQARPSNAPAQAEPLDLHAKILSRLFWPPLPETSFTLPPPITEKQESYEKHFETLKQSRKLTWLNSIGHVEVELHLEDRTVSEEVLPYQAAVIYAFQDSKARKVSDLATELEMAPALVRSACIFWLSKRVLTQPSTDADTFSVLENLPPTTSTTSDVQMSNSSTHPAPPPNPSLIAVEAAAAQASLLAQDSLASTIADERKDKMQMYRPFITAMLTNAGAMPLARIAMMLGIVVPGGFGYSSEELKDFLGGMVREGGVEVGVGGLYRVVG